MQITTARVSTAYGGVVVWKGERFNPELLLVDSVAIPGAKLRPKDDGRPQTKFPGGSNTENPDEPVLKTACRELSEETGLQALPNLLEQIWQTEVPFHTKVFYLVEFGKCQGELRTTDKPDGPRIIKPPYWMKAREVSRVLISSHHSPLLEAMNRLGVR